jgi:hypothetical protein
MFCSGTEAEQASIDKIANSVVDKLIKGGPTTEHEGEENCNVDLVHDTDNEAGKNIHAQNVPLCVC